jgi:hypothetical protein
MPLSYNPFSSTKLDYSKTPPPPPELAPKKKLFGEEEEKALRAIQDSDIKPSVERTVVREKEPELPEAQP